MGVRVKTSLAEVVTKKKEGKKNGSSACADATQISTLMGRTVLYLESTLRRELTYPSPWFSHFHGLITRRRSNLTGITGRFPGDIILT
jgi:hypothetical protein